MKRILELLDIDARIVEAVKNIVQVEGAELLGIQDKIKTRLDPLVADVYSNMREIEHQKYKLIELDIQLGNLFEMVKLLQRGEVK